MIIRPFREADRETVSALWDEVFPGEGSHNAPALIIRKSIAVQPELFFVAEDDGQVIGTVIAGYDGHRGWLYRVAVCPARQRRGVGAALIRHAEAALSALGCVKINLQVRANNADVVAFYQKLGFAIEERVSMGKRLPEAESS